MLLLRARQIAVGVALTAGLLAFGFYVTGTRVDALGGRSAPGAAGLQPFPGSQATHSTVLVDGLPTRVSECTTPALVGVVLDTYARLAAAESAPRDAPFLVQESPGAGAVMWSTADGRRRAVLLDADPAGGTRYRLLETVAATPNATRQLPRGMAAPQGMEAFLSVERPGGGGYALFSSYGPVARTAELCLAELSRVGMTTDPATRALLDQTRSGQVTLPLEDGQGGSRRGVLVVTPDGQGGSRASISIE